MTHVLSPPSSGLPTPLQEVGSEARVKVRGAMCLSPCVFLQGPVSLQESSIAGARFPTSSVMLEPHLPDGIAEAALKSVPSNHFPIPAGMVPPAGNPRAKRARVAKVAKVKEKGDPMCGTIKHPSCKEIALRRMPVEDSSNSNLVRRRHMSENQCVSVKIRSKVFVLEKVGPFLLVRVGFFAGDPEGYIKAIYVTVHRRCRKSSDK